MPETAYLTAPRDGRRLDHAYGPRVHVLSDPWSLSVMARLCHPDTRAPDLHRLLEACYRRLVQAAVERLPAVSAHLPTRMTTAHPGHGFDGEIVERSARAVVLDIARAGMIPAYVTQQVLLDLLEPDGVRVDHLYMQRVADASGRVTGVDVSGSKIGGPVAGATLFVPDPMAATGGSLSDALRLFHGLTGGPPAAVVALHLVVTPEFLRRITRDWPEVHIYALRVDRGLSPEDVLACRPGARWDEEVGLNDHSYIVPGAGGMGELINNAFV